MRNLLVVCLALKQMVENSSSPKIVKEKKKKKKSCICSWWHYLVIKQENVIQEDADSFSLSSPKLNLEHKSFLE